MVCSKCHRNGHNARTCSSAPPVALTAAAPPSSPVPASPPPLPVAAPVPLPVSGSDSSPPVRTIKRPVVAKSPIIKQPESAPVSVTVFHPSSLIHDEKNDTNEKDEKQVEEPQETCIPSLELLKRVYNNPQAQHGLSHLYKTSRSECMRNGVCGMEVGMAREKDQCAVLKLFLGGALNLDVNNDLPEDFLVLGDKISSKHSSSKIGSTVKAKWTSEKESVERDIQSMLQADDNYFPHLVLTYIGTGSNTIRVIGISSKHISNTIRTLGRDAFHIPSGNSRGIEYSRKTMALFLSQPYFDITFTYSITDNELNPIERRIHCLRSIGISGFD